MATIVRRGTTVLLVCHVIVNITKPMQWASSVSSGDTMEDVIRELGNDIQQQLGGSRPEVLVAFVSPGFPETYGKIPDLVQDLLAPGAFLGCTAMGVIGGGQEIEHQHTGRPAISMTAGLLPAVDIRTFHLTDDELPTPDAGPEEWVRVIGVPQDPVPHFVLLGDPQSFYPQPLLMGLDFAYSASAKIGGLASSMGEGNVLFMDDTYHTSGLVGATFSGNLVLDTVVAQGCRPVGEPLSVTSSERNNLVELNERPALDVLMEIFHSLQPYEQELVRTALHIGIATTEFKTSLGQGDFLIRHVINIDQKRGAIGIDESIRTGQTVQFHLRHADAATEDLELMLSKYQNNPPATNPTGALLFTCTGRGAYMFGEANHDSNALSNRIGNLPIGGFFCAGEIGQVGGSTYMHGYTSSFGIFRPER